MGKENKIKKPINIGFIHCLYGIFKRNWDVILCDFFCKKLDKWKKQDNEITKQKCQESIQLLQNIQQSTELISPVTNLYYNKPIQTLQQQIKTKLNKLDK